MRTIILSAIALLHVTATAQNNTASNIIEGGKTLVELVRIFKSPKNLIYGAPQQNIVEKKDSCMVKNITDFCIKNSTTNPLLVSLYRRNGNVYEPGVLTLKILAKGQECLYEIKAGIYKIKFEAEDEDEEKKIIREGEMKIVACTNFFQEIKNE
jgi:hypothetical protein